VSQFSPKFICDEFFNGLHLRQAISYSVDHFS
jgi:hypothetical protein